MDKANLLKEKFRRIRNHQLCHVLGALAVGTPAVVPHEAALLTGIHFKFIGRYHKPFKEQLRCAVTN